MPCREPSRCPVNASFHVLGHVQPQLGAVLKTVVKAPLIIPQTRVQLCDPDGVVAETYLVMWHATGVSGDGEEVSPVRHVEGGSMVWKDGRVWAKAWRQKFSGWSVMPRAVKRGRPQAQS